MNSVQPTHQWFQSFDFHSVINMPAQVYVHDFSNGEDVNPTNIPYSVGRYNEVRCDMYTAPQFLENQRNIHMGVDIAAPVGDPVFSFFDGEVFKVGDNQAEGDYGPTLVLKYRLKGHWLYALYGHLSKSSIEAKTPGQKVSKGEVIGWIGDQSVNGGWFPHLHFQLAWHAPQAADMPGVVALSERCEALKRYPDPRWVLGPIYPD